VIFWSIWYSIICCYSRYFDNSRCSFLIPSPFVHFTFDDLRCCSVEFLLLLFLDTHLVCILFVCSLRSVHSFWCGPCLPRFTVTHVPAIVRLRCLLPFGLQFVHSCFFAFGRIRFDSFFLHWFATTFCVLFVLLRSARWRWLHFAICCIRFSIRCSPIYFHSGDIRLFFAFCVVLPVRLILFDFDYSDTFCSDSFDLFSVWTFDSFTLFRRCSFCVCSFVYVSFTFAIYLRCFLRLRIRYVFTFILRSALRFVLPTVCVHVAFSLIPYSLRLRYCSFRLHVLRCFTYSFCCLHLSNFDGPVILFVFLFAFLSYIYGGWFRYTLHFVLSYFDSEFCSTFVTFHSFESIYILHSFTFIRLHSLILRYFLRCVPRLFFCSFLRLHVLRFALFVTLLLFIHSLRWCILRFTLFYIHFLIWSHSNLICLILFFAFDPFILLILIVVVVDYSSPDSRWIVRLLFDFLFCWCFFFCLLFTFPFRLSDFVVVALLFAFVPLFTVVPIRLIFPVVYIRYVCCCSYRYVYDRCCLRWWSLIFFFTIPLPVLFILRCFFFFTLLRFVALHTLRCFFTSISIYIPLRFLFDFVLILVPFCFALFVVNVWSVCRSFLSGVFVLSFDFVLMLSFHSFCYFVDHLFVVVILFVVVPIIQYLLLFIYSILFICCWWPPFVTIGDFTFVLRSFFCFDSFSVDPVYAFYLRSLRFVFCSILLPLRFVPLFTFAFSSFPTFIVFFFFLRAFWFSFGRFVYLVSFCWFHVDFRWCCSRYGCCHSLPRSFIDFALLLLRSVIFGARFWYISWFRYVLIPICFRSFRFFFLFFVFCVRSLFYVSRSTFTFRFDSICYRSFPYVLLLRLHYRFTFLRSFVVCCCVTFCSIHYVLTFCSSSLRSVWCCCSVRSLFIRYIRWLRLLRCSPLPFLVAFWFIFFLFVVLRPRSTLFVFFAFCLFSFTLFSDLRFFFLFILPLRSLRSLRSWSFFLEFCTSSVFVRFSFVFFHSVDLFAFFSFIWSLFASQLRCVVAFVFLRLRSSGCVAFSRVRCTLRYSSYVYLDRSWSTGDVVLSLLFRFFCSDFFCWFDSICCLFVYILRLILLLSIVYSFCCCWCCWFVVGTLICSHSTCYTFYVCLHSLFDFVDSGIRSFISTVPTFVLFFRFLRPLFYVLFVLHFAIVVRFVPDSICCFLHVSEDLGCCILIPRFRWFCIFLLCCYILFGICYAFVRCFVTFVDYVVRYVLVWHLFVCWSHSLLFDFRWRLRCYILCCC